MNLEDKDYINLNDLQGMLGQVCIVTLECGILCGINSLKIVSKSIDSIDQKFYSRSSSFETRIFFSYCISYID